MVKVPIELIAINLPGTAGSISRVTTLQPEILSLDKLEPPLKNFTLERAKTEGQRHHNILSEEAAQIFDDKIPVQQKVLLCPYCVCVFLSHDNIAHHLQKKVLDC